jgi:hypothetical protein
MPVDLPVFLTFIVPWPAPSRAAMPFAPRHYATLDPTTVTLEVAAAASQDIMVSRTLGIKESSAFIQGLSRLIASSRRDDPSLTQP